MNYTISEAKNEIKKGITAYIQKNEKGDYYIRSVNRIPFYLEGQPGIGKTEIVRQIAEELEIGFVNFSITHHTRNSLLGLPVISELEGGKYTEYTMSEIIAAVMEKEEKGQKEGILLLDEFNCASETIMPTMLAFLQTRNIGKYYLPEGWSIVLCGNPSSYNKNARKFDAVILDRVRKMSIEYDSKDFLEYAQEKEFHSSIIEYLKINKQHCYRCEINKEEEEIVTGRGWENLSHTIKMYEKLGLQVDQKLISQYIKSAEIARSFDDFCVTFLKKISIDDLYNILNNKNSKTYVEIIENETIDFGWKIIEQIVNFLNKEAEDIPLFDDINNKKVSQKISNIIHFIERLKNSSILMEHFFTIIHKKEAIVTNLATVRNEAYLNLCRKSYHEMEILDENCGII